MIYKKNIKCEVPTQPLSSDNMSLILHELPGLKQGHYVTYCDKVWYLVKYDTDKKLYYIAGRFLPDFKPSLETVLPEDYIMYVSVLYKSSRVDRLLEKGYNVELVSSFKAAILGPKIDVGVEIVPLNYPEAEKEDEEDKDESEKDEEESEEEEESVDKEPPPLTDEERERKRKAFEVVIVTELPVGYFMPKDASLNWILNEEKTVVGKLILDRSKISFINHLTHCITGLSSSDIKDVTAAGLKYDWREGRELFKFPRDKASNPAFTALLIEGLPNDYVMPDDKTLNWIISVNRGKGIPTVIGKLSCTREEFAAQYRKDAYTTRKDPKSGYVYGSYDNNKFKWIEHVTPLDEADIKDVEEKGCGMKCDSEALATLKSSQ